MSRERDILTFIGGIGIGAGLMYMLDPDRGSRRRALVRDKIISAANRVPDAAGATARDLRNRASGVVAGAKSLLKSDEVSDEVLVERVRSELGRVISHPRAIEVVAEQGRVTLSGPVLADEVVELISRVSSVRGVTGVENQLEVHEQVGDVPGLQGDHAPMAASD
jgi:osmotically-inducible protein OsmY